MLGIQVIDEGEIKTLVLSGKLDTVTAPQLESEGMSLISKGCKALIIDLNGLEYVSSAGLRSLLSIAKKTELLGAKMAICSGGLARNVLSMSGFGAVFPVRDTRAEAVAAALKPAGKKK